MNIIYLIIGLPGSGKSTLLKKIKRAHIVDDIKEINQLPKKDTKRIAITDPYFCREKVLNQAIKKLKIFYPNHEIKIIEFENSMEKAKYNAKKRNSKNVTKLIKSLSKNYITKNKRTINIKNV